MAFVRVNTEHALTWNTRCRTVMAPSPKYAGISRTCGYQPGINIRVSAGYTGIKYTGISRVYGYKVRGYQPHLRGRARVNKKP
eukprot:8932017-Pyramimonas_sp.AAC.1